MNFYLKNIPQRFTKPRIAGVNMIMDKGLSLGAAHNLVEACGPFIDFIKLGFGTAYLTPQLKEKIKLYQDNGIHVYLGGTLAEAFIIRHQFDDYIKLLQDLQLEYAEISDGCMTIPHEEKCGYIKQLKDAGYKVLSEVGSKDAQKVMAPYKWLEQMEKELEAGSSFLITESREAGNIGIYRGTGEVREGLIEEILTKIPQEKIIWEAPQKNQQLFFIQLLGPNVNLGNIATDEVLALETMRIGLRGDTFHLYLQQE